MAITRREAAIITAYTGVVLGEFEDARKYIDEIMGRNLLTHELAFLSNVIKEAAKPDFFKLEVKDESEPYDPNQVDEWDWENDDMDYFYEDNSDEY